MQKFGERKDFPPPCLSLGIFVLEVRNNNLAESICVSLRQYLTSCASEYKHGYAITYKKQTACFSKSRTMVTLRDEYGCYG